MRERTRKRKGKEAQEEEEKRNEKKIAHQAGSEKKLEGKLGLRGGGG